MALVIAMNAELESFALSNLSQDIITSCDYYFPFHPLLVDMLFPYLNF